MLSFYLSTFPVLFWRKTGKNTTCKKPPQRQILKTHHTQPATFPVYCCHYKSRILSKHNLHCSTELNQTSSKNTYIKNAYRHAHTRFWWLLHTAISIYTFAYEYMQHIPTMQSKHYYHIWCNSKSFMIIKSLSPLTSLFLLLKKNKKSFITYRYICYWNIAYSRYKSQNICIKKTKTGYKILFTQLQTVLMSLHSKRQNKLPINKCRKCII